MVISVFALKPCRQGTKLNKILQIDPKKFCCHLQKARKGKNKTEESDLKGISDTAHVAVINPSQ